MLAVYLVCLAVGAVFVGMSIFAGHDHGVGDGDSDLAGHDVGGHDVGGHDVGGHEVGGHDHGGYASLPFLSLRFWTFAAFFFGLCGLALRELAGTPEPVTALASAAVGAFTGTGATWLIRRLKRPVGATVANDHWVGQVGEMLHPLGPGQVSKLVVRAGARPERELLAVLSYPEAGSIDRGMRVIILAMHDGKAVVQLESQALGMPTVDPQVPAAREQHEQHESHENAKEDA